MNKNRVPAAVFDLDGTVADDRWRRHLIDMEQADPDARYERYHLACEADPVVNHHRVMSMVKRELAIVFATARPERHRQRTADWIIRQFPDLSFSLVMRPDNDHRHSPDLKSDMMQALRNEFLIECIYDDLPNVVKRLKLDGWNAILVTTCGDGHKETHSVAKGAGDRLRSMAKTFDERNAQYGDNWRMVPKVVEVLFPNGVPPWLLTDPRWHLFELKLVKLTRFAISELRHADSIHDDGVYSAMIEHIIEEEGK